MSPSTATTLSDTATPAVHLVARPATAPAGVGIFDDLRQYLLTGGTFAVPALSAPVTIADAWPLRAALAEDSLRVVAETLAATMAAPARPEPSLLALAMAAAHEDDLTRRAALTALPRVARSAADLFRFATYVQGQRGWGRGLRRAIGAWYNDRAVPELVDEVLRTPADGDWRHADLLRLGHPKSRTPAHDAVFRWLVTGTMPQVGDEDAAVAAALARLASHTRLQAETDPATAASLITAHALPVAAVPVRLRAELPVLTALAATQPVADVLPLVAAAAGREGIGEVVATVRARLAGDVPGLDPLAVAALAATGGDATASTEDVTALLGEAFDAACRAWAPLGQRLILTIDAAVASPADREGRPAPGEHPELTVAATLALLAARTEADGASVVVGRTPRPLVVAPWHTVADVAGHIARVAGEAGGPAPARRAPVTLTAVRPGGTIRSVALWPRGGGGLRLVNPAGDDVATHGLDDHTVRLAFRLLRDG